MPLFYNNTGLTVWQPVFIHLNKSPGMPWDPSFSMSRLCDTESNAFYKIEINNNNCFIIVVFNSHIIKKLIKFVKYDYADYL